MITNKEFILKIIDKIIREYEIIIKKELFSKRNRIKNNITIFSSKSILCQQENRKKLCERDTKKGCFFYSGITGCSTSNTFPLRVMRDNVNVLNQRLIFWKSMKRTLESMPTTLFIKKYRTRLHEIARDIDDNTYLKFQKYLNK